MINIKKIISNIYKDDSVTKKILQVLKFFRLFSIKNNFILFDNLSESHTEAIDTYTLFLWMRENGYNVYYILYKKNPLYKKLKEENKLKRIICLDESGLISNEFLFKTFFKLINTKIIVTSFGIPRTIIEKFIHADKKLKYVFIPHGLIVFKNCVLKDGFYTPKKFNYFVVSSENEKAMLMDYNWKEENLIVAGLPRWDGLKREEHSKKMIFAFLTWRNSFSKWDFDFGGEIIDTMYYKKLVSFLNNQKLNDLLIANNIKLVYGVHHSLLDQCREEFRLNTNFEIADPNKISQYIKETDLFITDFSSIVFDFLYLDIPSIFYRLDHMDKQLSPLDLDDMLYSTSKDNQVFNVFYDEESTIDKIEYYIKNNFKLEPEFIEKSQSFFSIKKDICKALTEKLLKL